MKIPYSKDKIKKAVVSLLRENKLTECYIRPLVFYSYGSMGLGVSSSSVDVMIAAWSWGTYLGEKNIRAAISKYRRFSPDSAIMDAKISGYYVNSIMASNDAAKRGADEAIMLDHKGNVAEGPGENIFIIKKGILYTPAKGSILPGITRDTVIRLAKEMRIKVREEIITKAELTGNIMKTAI